MRCPEIEDDQLYRVVSGMYSAQMLGTVKEKSLGLLSIEPKDENGRPITDFATRVLRDGNGSEIKEWYALAAYLQSFGDEGVPERYGMPKGDGRKSVEPQLEPHRAAPLPQLDHPGHAAGGGGGPGGGGAAGPGPGPAGKAAALRRRPEEVPGIGCRRGHPRHQNARPRRQGPPCEEERV